MRNIKIAVASGKGGTGKTMVATSLATVISRSHSVQLIDCDVEAPNAHLFLHPQILIKEAATINIPVINEDECIACGKCVDVCEFNALAMLRNKILVFPQLCHGCGSCSFNCPVDAIYEQARIIGEISIGKFNGGMDFYMGKLTVSEPMPTPVIRQLKTATRQVAEIAIYDSPPGASCSVVATINDADFVLLVTEPTPFGLHDLKQMLGVIAQTNASAGVIINRDNIGDDRVDTYLADTPYPILMRIPYQTAIAQGLAAGQLLTDFMPIYQEKFMALIEKIKEMLQIKDNGPC